MFEKTNEDSKTTIHEEAAVKSTARKSTKKVNEKESVTGSLQAAREEKLFSLYQYVGQYLDALDEDRVDNQRVLVKVVRKIQRDLDDLYKE